MYYIGSHWGTEDDGYICSSNRMRNVYRRRPEDFKRRILKKITTNRKALLEVEEKWLQMVKDKKRYYNLHFTTHHWISADNSKTIRQKMSDSAKKKFEKNPELKIQIANSLRGRKNPEHSKRMKNRTPWNKGIKTGKQSPELVEKRMKKLRSLERTPEWCNKISEGQKRRWNRQKANKQCMQ